MPSCMSENPGPDVAVRARAPAHAAPMTAAREAISSSICITAHPSRGSRAAMASATSVAGVMGYPAKKSQPPRMAPYAHATSPWANCSRGPRTVMTRR